MLLITASAVLYPAVARACSCAPSWFESRSPADGAVDVPLDVIPWIVLYGIDEQTIEFEDQDGVAVEFTVRDLGHGAWACDGMHAEILPTTQLLPATTYTLRSPDSVVGPDTVSFTTVADGPTSTRQIPTTPNIEAIVLDGNTVGDSCLGQYQMCLRVSASAMVEVTILAGDEQLNHFIIDSPGDVMLLVEAIGSVEPTCVEVRSRDVSGQLSEAAELCGDALVVKANIIEYYDPDEFWVECDQVFDDQSPDSSDAVVQPASDDGPPPEDSDASDGAGVGPAATDGGTASPQSSPAEADEEFKHAKSCGCSTPGSRSSHPIGLTLCLPVFARLRRRLPRVATRE